MASRCGWQGLYGLHAGARARGALRLSANLCLEDPGSRELHDLSVQDVFWLGNDAYDVGVCLRAEAAFGKLAFLKRNDVPLGVVRRGAEGDD